MEHLSSSGGIFHSRIPPPAVHRSVSLAVTDKQQPMAVVYRMLGGQLDKDHIVVVTEECSQDSIVVMCV